MNSLFLRSLTDMQDKGSLKFYESFSLSRISTFGIGGRARAFVIPTSIDSLCKVLMLAEDNKTVGNCSNLLFDDHGSDKTVVSCLRLNAIELIDEPRNETEQYLIGLCADRRMIRAECGAMLPRLVSVAARNSLKGFEGLCSVPATVGGALTLNAGAYGCEIADKLLAYEVFSPERGRQLVVADKGLFSYRASPIPHSAQTVLCAYFSSETGEIAAITERIELNKALRRKSQPINERSAGSYFKRPENAGGKSAGELIDRCGLKGISVGNAAVSEKHANFIINKGGATASDVLTLADKVKRIVRIQTGIELIPEVEYVR